LRWTSSPSSRHAWTRTDSARRSSASLPEAALRDVHARRCGRAVRTARLRPDRSADVLLSQCTTLADYCRRLVGRLTRVHGSSGPSPAPGTSRRLALARAWASDKSPSAVSRHRRVAVTDVLILRRQHISAASCAAASPISPLLLRSCIRSRCATRSSLRTPSSTNAAAPDSTHSLTSSSHLHPRVCRFSQAAGSLLPTPSR
jgi:hypothetical protein